MKIEDVLRHHKIRLANMTEDVKEYEASSDPELINAAKMYKEQAEMEGIVVVALQKQIPKEPVIRTMPEDIQIENATFKAGTKTYTCQCGGWVLPSWTYCTDCGQRLKQDPICNTTKLPCSGCQPCCSSRK